MTKQEREHLIEWLSAWSNRSRDCFKNWTDDQLIAFYTEQVSASSWRENKRKGWLGYYE